MPTSNDFLRDAQHFEVWFRDQFSKNMPWEDMPPGSLANILLMHMTRFLIVKKGEFNKYRVISRYLEASSPFTDPEMLGMVNRILSREDISRQEHSDLIRYSRSFRDEMNSCLGTTL